MPEVPVVPEVPEVPRARRNLIGGLAVAVVLALPFVVPRVGGIDTWKILLAVAGLAVFRYGDRLARK